MVLDLDPHESGFSPLPYNHLIWSVLVQYLSILANSTSCHHIYRFPLSWHIFGLIIYIQNFNFLHDCFAHYLLVSLDVNLWSHVILCSFSFYNNRWGYIGLWIFFPTTEFTIMEAWRSNICCISAEPIVGWPL